jgi:beta-lactamase superfamily II metal-dependent hydrolase
MKSSRCLVGLLALVTACTQAEFDQFANHLLQADAVEIVFLDVGQGDAVLVRTPGGSTLLIDAGRGRDIVEILQEYGVESIDLLVGSHADADHIGGVDDVIRAVPVEAYLDNGLCHGTVTCIDLNWMINNSGIEYLQWPSGQVELGGVRLEFWEPPNVDGLEPNNYSIGLLIEYGEFRALLTGDSEIEELNHFLSVGVPDVTLLKAAHHGSRDAVSPAWLDATKPEVVVISVGADNPFGHPDLWALHYYDVASDEIYRTDRDGDVTILGHFDGSYEVRTTR